MSGEERVRHERVDERDRLMLSGEERANGVEAARNERSPWSERATSAGEGR